MNDDLNWLQSALELPPRDLMSSIDPFNGSLFQDRTRVEYLCKTDKRLLLHRVFLNEKDGAGKAAAAGLKVGQEEEDDVPMEESPAQD